METRKLTVRLPDEDLAFLKAYAREHGLTVTEVIDRYLRRMRLLRQREPSQALAPITGLVPAEVDAESEWRQRQLRKHA